MDLQGICSPNTALQLKVKHAFHRFWAILLVTIFVFTEVLDCENFTGAVLVDLPVGRLGVEWAKSWNKQMSICSQMRRQKVQSVQYKQCDKYCYLSINASLVYCRENNANCISLCAFLIIYLFLSSPQPALETTGEFCLEINLYAWEAVNKNSCS